MIVNALAPVLNTIPFTSVTAEIETATVFDKPKVAVSAGPLGTVAGVQLAAVFQSAVPGIGSHIALPASARLVSSRSTNALQLKARITFAIFIRNEG